ncbi:hypothetical protein EC973_005189 [Apophysomyces ossiformis]|uniref:AN1-type domain-containing protein n=1 Tax=Apophysomyces ossiformis TaxID=679940 RepID=A0A8H7BXZ4_9FUNG|nr:hypothetical protein EC973_005189 [Apophysomyces ossiformis]
MKCFWIAIVNFRILRVPTCPLCDRPVPIPRGQDPNIQVNRHIQNNCAEPEKPSNVCRLRGCKAKLLVPMQCPECDYSYCVKHRLALDHQCEGKPKPTNTSGLKKLKDGLRPSKAPTAVSRAEQER